MSLINRLPHTGRVGGGEVKRLKLPRRAKSPDDARALLTEMLPLFRIGCGIPLPGGGMRVTMETGLSSYVLTVMPDGERVSVSSVDP